MLDGEPYYRENPVEKCRQAAKASGNVLAVFNLNIISVTFYHFLVGKSI